MPTCNDVFHLGLLCHSPKSVISRKALLRYAYMDVQCRSPSPTPVWKHLHPSSGPRRPSPDSSSPGRALHNVQSELQRSSRMPALAQAPRRDQSPHTMSSGMRGAFGTSTSQEAPEIAEIDARLQALQTFLKEARVSCSANV